MFAYAFALVFAACSPEGGSRELPELPPLPPRLADASPETGPPVPLREAIVAFTASVRGEIDVCGCPTTPFGGFERREVLVGHLRTHEVPVFAVDAGEMLVKGLTARDEADRRMRAETVLDLAAAVGLDAWAASPIDLTPGGPGLLRDRGALSANWAAADGQGFEAARVVERDGVRLGFVGVSASEGSVDPAVTVAAVRAAMAEPADLWIALSNAGSEVDLALAEGVPGLGAVLATAGDRFDEPRRTRGAPIIEAPARGRYVQVLHVFLGTDDRALELVNRGVWKDVALARGRAVAAGDRSDVVREEMRRDQARLSRLTEGHNLVFVESIPLDAGYEPDSGPTGVSERVDSFRAQVLENASASSAKTDDRSGYATGSSCSGCHPDRIASWGFDGHAQAMASLISRGAQADPECVGCHTTGFGRPGGFASVEPGAVDAFRDVQCEACHGPMRGHSGRGDVRSLPVTEATCRACHDEANSPNFDFDAYLSRVSCVRVGEQSRPDR
jgi:hypothetical protein